MNIEVNPQHLQTATDKIRDTAQGMACDLITDHGVHPKAAILTTFKAMAGVLAENVIEAANAFGVEMSDSQRIETRDRIYKAACNELKILAIGERSRRLN